MSAPFEGTGPSSAGRSCLVLWAPALDRPEYQAYLDAAERARYAAMREAGDRARFVTGRVLAKRAVAAATGVPHERVVFSLACRRCGAPHGGPWVPGQPVRFSLSHSGGRVALAVTSGAEPGVDVEVVPGGDRGRLAARVLSPAELAVYEAAVPERRGWTFATYWARKEALLKAVGLGLASPLRAITVSSPELPARLVSWARAPDGTDFSLVDLRPGPGYAAALAVRQREPIDLTEHHLDDPLDDPR